MRHLCLMSLTLALVTGCTDETIPTAPDAAASSSVAATEGMAAATGATSATVRGTGFLDVTVWSSCVEEYVQLVGPVAFRIQTTIDGVGRPHQVAFYSWKDVIAVGQNSGDTWHTTAAIEQYTMFNYEPVEPHQPAPARNPLGAPAVFHHTGAIRLLSDSNEQDLYVRHLVQTTIDANGNVRVDTDLLEVLACR